MYLTFLQYFQGLRVFPIVSRFTPMYDYNQLENIVFNLNAIEIHKCNYKFLC